MIMFMSTIMMLSSMKWLMMWITMEINLLMTIPFIFESKNKESSEKIMIYFLTQTMASILFIMMIVSKYMFVNEFISKMIMSMSMMIKLGVPPFHMWMPEMVNKMNWMTTLIMITLQKINPMVVIMHLMDKNLMFPSILILASSIGSISGINQLSLNKIMAFSSINHMSWMMMCNMINSQMWMKYFMMYTIINVTICVMFHLNKTYYINQVNMNNSMTMKMSMLLMMLNLGGMPPLPGFMLKWMTMEMTMNSNLLFMMLTIMVLSSMITLLFYMRIMYFSMVLQSYTMKFMIVKSKNITLLMFLMNLITPLMVLI
uniref:NADH-ubiquinone oxidoreductase chain 2 n=1 Tax=Eteoneus sigillatus TaxID=1964414 RepID=A0A343BT66_9HEMI|nr:NADH dehydrogenase subunit 2 [Eteoneus sigillatus]